MTRPTLRHLPALDGLRGVAVLAVLGYHADVAWLPGGFLGVELFFVVSGFLITSLLLGELAQPGGGRLRLAGFWFRRARRLLPALGALAVGLCLIAVVAPDRVTGVGRDLPWVLSYSFNWHLIWADVPYFEQLGQQSAVQHLWSLAIEEQFYLLWPLVVSVAALGGRRRVGLVCAGGALLSVVAMWAMADDPMRAYYGTDTRAAGLLLGGLLACSGVAARDPHPAPPARPLIGVAGALALVMVLRSFVVVDEFDTALYRGGFARFSILATVVIFVATVPGSAVARVLSWGPLRAAGLRSYSLYLWHWPIFQMTRPGLDWWLTGRPALLLRLLLTAVAAELSYRLVEAPARRWEPADVRSRLAWARSSLTDRLGRWRPLSPVPLGLAIAVVLILAGASLPGADDRAAASIEVAPTTTTTEAPTTTTSPPPAVVPVTAPPTTLPPPPPTTAPLPPPPPAVHVVAIGDSVMVGAHQRLLAAFGPATAVDAVVGRQPVDGPAALAAALAAGATPQLVLVHLGSNGILRDEHVDQLAAMVPGVPIVFVTAHVPRRWEAPSNEAVHRAPQRHATARIAEWDAAVDADPSLVGDDGIHPTQPGLDRYLALIVQAATPPPAA